MNGRRMLDCVGLWLPLWFSLAGCGNEITKCVDADKDGYFVGEGCGLQDCDDSDPEIHPSAKEICGNGIDENCDGADEPCVAECTDRDGDRYGVGPGCLGPDCDDNDPAVHPGATEVCGNGKDDDCQGGDAKCNCIDKDGDQYGVGTDCLGPDCNDNDPAVHPGAKEICGNGKDDDCQGGDAVCQDCVDSDGDHYGVGSDCLGPDCNDNNPNVHPGATEICNDQIDNNCDGKTDADDSQCSCADKDGDGYRDIACGGDDCDDNNPNIHPGATEICGNGIDEDCVGGDAACNCGADCGLGNICDINSNTCRALRIEEYWAPVFYQDVDASCLGGACDFFTRFDYDGDNIGNNNWANLENFPKKAVVYFSLVESESHYFIGYYLFHPRTNGWGAYANEMKGAMLVVRKGSGGASDYGELMLMETMFEYDGNQYFSQYVPSGSTLQDWLAHRDGEFHFSQSGGHNPIIYVKSGFHDLFGDESWDWGVGRWERDGFPGTDGIIYSYQQQEGEPQVQQQPASQEVGYNLVDLKDSLWPLRNEFGGSKLFDQFGRFDGGEHQGGLAFAPWHREDYYDRFSYGLPTGAYLYDPVDFFNQHFHGFDPWSVVYVRNPYAVKVTALRYEVLASSANGYLRIFMKDAKGQEFLLLGGTDGTQNSWYGRNNGGIGWIDLAQVMPQGRNFFYGFDYPENLVNPSNSDSHFGIESRHWIDLWFDGWLMQPAQRQYYQFLASQTLDWVDSICEVRVDFPIVP